MKYKLIVLDRDNLLNKNSSDVNSPLYYLTHKDSVALKDGVYNTIQNLKELNIPLVLATRQRGISRGLLSRADVDNINFHLELLLNVKFSSIYVEERSKTKLKIFSEILNDFEIPPHEILIVDDGEDHCTVGQVLGCATLCTENLADVLKVLE